MTIDEIRATDKTMLSPNDIAEVLGSNPHTISMTARMAPERVGYPFTFTGNRMKIPRIGFINWMEGNKDD